MPSHSLSQCSVDSQGLSSLLVTYLLPTSEVVVWNLCPQLAKLIVAETPKFTVRNASELLCIAVPNPLTYPLRYDLNNI